MLTLRAKYTNGKVEFDQVPPCDDCTVLVTFLTSEEDGLVRIVSGSQAHQEFLETRALMKQFTNRELEVLNFLRLGLSNREIGQRLNIKAGTVRNYTYRIYRKLHAHNRTEAVKRALDLGIITL